MNYKNKLPLINNLLKESKNINKFFRIMKILIRIL